MSEPLLGPFGNPDGARSNLTSNSGFVLFEDERTWGALACEGLRPAELIRRMRNADLLVAWV